jgi:phosphotransferase system enzyme I (PtsI)
MKMLSGVSVAPGVAIARPFILEPEGAFCPLKQSLSEADAEKDVKRFEAAVKVTEENIAKSRDRVAARLGAGHGAIFDAHLLILKDPLLVKSAVEQARKEKVNVAWTFSKTIDKFSAMMTSIGDDYLKERSNDIRDVGAQVMRVFAGTENRSIKNLKEKVIIISEDLSPSETADIPKDKVVGFATAGGSRTSHTAIVAQALELPALVAVNGLRDIALGGELVIIDGMEGKLIIDPDEATIVRYRRNQKVADQRRLDLRKLRQLPAETPDGHRVLLMANLEMPLEVHAADNAGADGIGLYRTEFLFLNRDTVPTEDEQYQWYSKVVKAMAPRPVTIRSVDLGGDKFMKQGEVVREMNPFLGLRGIRLCLANQDLFRSQLRAILRSSVHGKAHLMFPMVSSVEEFRQARRIVDDVRSELKSQKVKFDETMQIGVMIETPSAALVADLLAREADFFSIGTNDLVQYSIAVDRGNPAISHLYEPMHPAILRLIRMVINMAHQEQIKVAVCGELAADPLAGPLLLGLGLDIFSVSPVALSTVKSLLRSVSFVDARNLAQEAMTLPTAQAVKELIRGRVSQSA